MIEGLSIQTFAVHEHVDWPHFDEYFTTFATAVLPSGQPFNAGYLHTAICRDFSVPFTFFIELHVYPLYRNQKIGKRLMIDRMNSIPSGTFGMLINGLRDNLTNPPQVLNMYENLGWEPYKARSQYFKYNPFNANKKIISQAAKRIGDI